MYNWWILTA